MPGCFSESDPSHTETTMACWNIRSGGFSTYGAIGANEPVRGEAIRESIAGLGTESVALIDTDRWLTTYEGEAGIARHLGYAAARTVLLDDERLNRDMGDQIGITLATDRVIQASGALDLETRQALRVVLDVGRHGLQVAVAYFDDLYENVRRQQARALIAGLEADVPTIILGDLNTLRPNMSGASVRTKIGDAAVRLAAILPVRGPLGVSVRGINERSVLHIFESSGYIDSDPLKRPTAPARLPLFGVDYVLHTAGIDVHNLQVTSSNGASDHQIITFGAKTL